jgi:hypothetical protein
MKTCMAILFLAALSAAAHHSFTADFDVNQPVTLTATVAKFEMMNPHSWIHVDVKTQDGAVERWEVETGSTNALFRRGWKKDSLKPGDAVIIEGYRAKDGSRTANATAVKLPDGRRVLAGSSRDSEKSK